MKIEDKLIEKLAEAKKLLTKRLEELKNEIEIIEECIKIVDEQLVKRSFISAEKLVESKREKVEGKPEIEEKEYAKITYRNTRGEKTLAKIFVNEKMKIMRIKIEENIPVDAPLLQNFLINGVIKKMQLDDEGKVDRGEIKAEEALKYKLNVNGNMINEIVIENISDEERRIRIRNAAKWTFTRLYENIRGVSS